MNTLLTLALILTLPLSAKTIDIEHYHNNSSIQWSFAISALYDISFQGNETILDLGTADGKIAAYLASKVPQGAVIGLDSSKEAIDFANNRFSFPNLSFIQNDATVFSSPQDYDLITAFCTLNWIDQKELAFAKIRANLKPNGHALIVVPCDIPETEILYENYAKNSGLKIIFCRKERTQVIFHNSDELKEWLRSIRPHLPEKEFNELFEKHLQIVNQVFPQAGDGRVYAFPYKLTLLLKKNDYLAS